MNNKQSGFIAYSFTGVAIMLVLLVIVNVIAGLVSLPRMDLTSERLYTLSDGTKDILGDLDTDVEIRFYATRDDRLMPAQLKNYIVMLRIFSMSMLNANGHLKLQV